MENEKKDTQKTQESRCNKDIIQSIQQKKREKFHIRLMQLIYIIPVKWKWVYSPTKAIKCSIGLSSHVISAGPQHIYDLQHQKCHL